jgi:very-short-patch-repair endonuclease
MHPGVYALGHSALSLWGRLSAALLYGGDQAVLSHTTAAWLWSLIETEPRRIHLTVPGRRLSLPDVRVHRSRGIEVTQCDGFPVTSVGRTLLDLAAVLSLRELRRALAEADYCGLLAAEEVRAMCRPGRQGSRALRRALKTHIPELAETLSVLEERFLALCQEARLPIPEANAKVGGMRVDALWADQRVIAELDGAAAHGGWSRASRDREREMVLRGMDFRVVRYTWKQVTERSREVVTDLRRLLAS